MSTVVLVCCVAFAGCTQKMEDQPRLEPYERSEFFGDHLSMQAPVDGTVARGEAHLDTHFYEGKIDGQLATTLPEDVTLDERLLTRGRERFGAYCSMCHGLAGEGNGMVVARGFPAPPSYGIERLRRVPVGHLFDVVTHGIGRMPRLEDRIPPADRWAIVAYVRALQVSRHAEVDDGLRAEVERGIAAAESAADAEAEGETHE